MVLSLCCVSLRPEVKHDYDSLLLAPESSQGGTTANPVVVCSSAPAPSRAIASVVAPGTKSSEVELECRCLVLAWEPRVLGVDEKRVWPARFVVLAAVSALKRERQVSACTEDYPPSESDLCL